jgi:uncharacterized cupredoxin-like copper-binding protein
MKVLIALAVGAVLLSACTTAAEDDQAGPQEIGMTMTEFAFEPSAVTLTTGDDVVVVLTNDGAVPHEFMAGRQPMPDDGGYMEDFFAGVSPTVTPSEALTMDAHDAHAGFMVQVEPGQTVQVGFTVPDDRQGEWEIGCFEPGHYEAGMHATLTASG